MKTYLKTTLILLSIILTSCEDVVDIAVKNEAPRLVIEASLDWEKGTQGNEQTIKLSTSTPYFDTTVNSKVTGASVRVTNDNDLTQYVFVDQNDGTYTISDFIPVLNQSYTLEVVYNNEVYVAHETLMPVTDITEIYQSVEGGFDDEVVDINVLFSDPENEENYYMMKFQEQGDLFPELYDLDDEFTNGNEMTVFYEKTDNENTNEEELEPGDIVDIQLLGISEQYYNYIRLLIEQVEFAGDIFSSTPVALKGNCINSTNPNNPAYGYFRLAQVVKASYTVE
ncbi:MAG: DUF4249 domain-containing protein [Allomuricauda sp.]